MSKITNYVGIDISKDFFDVFDPMKGHMQYSNDSQGIKLFFKTLSPESWCIMEATGSYYQKLAMFLYTKEISLSVVNPLVVKRFIQMKLRRNKNDKADAKMISQYGNEQQVTQWKPDPEYIELCSVLFSTMELYTKQLTALKNKLHSVQSRGIKGGVIVKSLNKQIKLVNQEMKLLEDEMDKLIKQNDPQLLSNLSSIPGIGKKTAILLITSTNGFRNFESYKQVCSFLGLAPTERSSGSSIRGKSRISKAGNPLIRNHLFLCSFTACNCNPACKLLYDRIVTKGKCKKLALIAVANKLLKQCFGIAKNGLPYDPDFKSKYSH